MLVRIQKRHAKRKTAGNCQIGIVDAKKETNASGKLKPSICDAHVFTYTHIYTHQS